MTFPSKRNQSHGENINNKSINNTEYRDHTEKRSEALSLKRDPDPLQYLPKSKLESSAQKMSFTFKYQFCKNNFGIDEPEGNGDQRKGIMLSNGYLHTKRFPSLSKYQNNSTAKFGQQKRSLFDDLDHVRVKVLVPTPSQYDHKQEIMRRGIFI